MRLESKPGWKEPFGVPGPSSVSKQRQLRLGSSGPDPVEFYITTRMKICTYTSVQVIIFFCFAQLFKQSGAKALTASQIKVLNTQHWIILIAKLIATLRAPANFVLSEDSISIELDKHCVGQNRDSEPSATNKSLWVTSCYLRTRNLTASLWVSTKPCTVNKKIN